MHVLHVGHFLVSEITKSIFQFCIRIENGFYIAAIGALESHFFLKNRDTLAILSEQQVLDCSISDGKRCQKGFMNKVFEYSKNNGLITGDKYPYKGPVNDQDIRCPEFESSLKIKGFESIAKGNEKDLKDAVCRFGPVSIALDASAKNFSLYNYGVYKDMECRSDYTNHAALVVGYGFDEKSDLPYWLVKNSFGVLWGEEGYIRVARDFNNHCGIANLASYPVV